jgi:hypothetical protein
MEWKEFLHWGFEALLTGSAIYLIGLVNKAADSIERLNVSVSTLLERTTNQEKRIDLQDKRIERLEERFH